MADEKIEGGQLNEEELENVVGGRRTKFVEKPAKPVVMMDDDTPIVPSSPYSGSTEPLGGGPLGIK